MRVLLANKFFFRNGGSEAVMFQERDFLRSAGCEVIDFSMQDRRNLRSDHADFFVAHQSYADSGGGAAARIRSAVKLIHSPEAVRKMGRLIELMRPDLVHCHNIYHQLTPSIIRAAKRRGVPVVLTLHDYKPICPVYTRLRHGQVCSECIGNRFSNVLRHRCADGSLGKSTILFAEALVQRLLRSYEQIDTLVAPSEFMRSSVTRHRFPKDRVEVIYNGIDCRGISPASEDRGYALFLGRLSPEKGVGTLLKAHAAIAGLVPLVVAGTGPLEPQMRSRYPQARFLGHVSGTMLEETIRNAALIVIPSEWYENCPMSVLEAMVVGKAVVASNIGGIPELVVHGKTGLLFPPGDEDALQTCLMHLMENPELRRSYGVAGRKRAEQRFSLEQHNRALLRVYLTLVNPDLARETSGVSA